ncbi:sufE-like protein 1, chloroplastic/mitochondrial [Wolffia australiana]
MATAAATAALSGNLLRSKRPDHAFLSARRLSVASFPLSFPFLSWRPGRSTHPVRSLPPQQQQQQQQQQEEAVDPDLLPDSLREIVSLFQSVSDPKAKYQQLLHYGGRLPRLDPRFKTDEHRVRGCVSQVWVRAFPDPIDPSAVRFEADSDSALTKGLAALLVLGLSGAQPQAIARVPPQFVHLLGLRQSLTPSRNNGFLNMLKLMQIKALQISQSSSPPVSPNSPNPPSEENPPSKIPDPRPSIPAVDPAPGGGRAARIRQRLQKALLPLELDVDDVSYQHAGHVAVRGSGDGETHFNLRIVSREFEGKSLVKRHRLVYDLLQEELQTGLHAVSISAKTPSEV